MTIFEKLIFVQWQFYACLQPQNFVRGQNVFIYEFVQKWTVWIFLLMFYPVKGSNTVFINTTKSSFISLQLQIIKELPQTSSWILFKILEIRPELDGVVKYKIKGNLTSQRTTYSSFEKSSHSWMTFSHLVAPALTNFLNFALWRLLVATVLV